VGSGCNVGQDFVAWPCAVFKNSKNNNQPDVGWGFVCPARCSLGHSIKYKTPTINLVCSGENKTINLGAFLQGKNETATMKLCSNADQCLTVFSCSRNCHHRFIFVLFGMLMQVDILVALYYILSLTRKNAGPGKLMHLLEILLEKKSNDIL